MQPIAFDWSWVPAYAGYNAYTPTIPKLYMGVYSQEQRIKAICEEICKIVAYLKSVVDTTNNNTNGLELLEKAFNLFIESGYDDIYKDLIKQYIDDNMDVILRELYTRNVYFGLTLDGHFVAYVPDSWHDIGFDTGMVYGTESYGRLILTWDIGSPHDAMWYRRYEGM